MTYKLFLQADVKLPKSETTPLDLKNLSHKDLFPTYIDVNMKYSQFLL